MYANQRMLFALALLLSGAPHTQAFHSTSLSRSPARTFSPKSQPFPTPDAIHSTSSLQATPWMPPEYYTSVAYTLRTGLDHLFALPLSRVGDALRLLSRNLSHMHAPAVWRSYVLTLRNSPIITKTLTAATLCFGGDALAQQSEKEYSIQRGLAFLIFGALYTGCFQHYWFSELNTHVVDWGEAVHLWGHAAATHIPVEWFTSTGNDAVDGVLQSSALDLTTTAYTSMPWWQYFDVVSQIEDVMGTLQDPPTAWQVALSKVLLNQGLTIPFVYMPLFFGVTGAVGGLSVEQSLARAQSLYLPLLQRNYLYWIPMQFIQFYVLPVDLQVPFVCVASLVWTIILSSISSNATQEMEESTAVLDDTTTSTIITTDTTDLVTAETVVDELVPDVVLQTADRILATWQGRPELRQTIIALLLGLVASSSDEATLAASLSEVLGVETSSSVALVSLLSASMGYLWKTDEEGELNKQDDVVDVISDQSATTESV